MPAALLACWLIVSAYSNERRAVERNLTESARGLSLLVDTSLQEREALLLGLATSRQIESGNLARFREQCIEVLHRPDEWIVLADVGGQQLVNTGQPPDAALPKSTVPDELRASLVSTGRYISNFTIGPATGRSLVFLTVPVVHAGRPPQALSMVMTTGAVSRMFLDHGIGTGWLISLIDRQGRIIARNREPEKYVGASASERMMRAAAARSAGIMESVTLDGIKSLTAFNRSERSGWTVVLAAPRNDLLHRAQVLAVVAGIVSVVSGAVAIILAVSVGRAVVRGVGHLVTQTEKLREGTGVALATGMDETDIVSRALADAGQALRTREEELARARDAALAASRAKDEFLATLSHELRTPLNPVLLVASDAAADESLSAEVREMFQGIVKNVQLEARLIDDLLDLTRITRGKLALDLHPLDVHTVLTDALGAVAGEARRKGIELRLELRAVETTVAADSVRLQQVFWNILNNAIKFTPPGGHVSVTTISTGEEIKIALADTGLGLTADEIARIFKPFTQGDHASGNRSSPFGGLGIGLAISRLLVERHGGHISATSPGRSQGATFTIVLPLVASASRPSPGGVTNPMSANTTDVSVSS